MQGLTLEFVGLQVQGLGLRGQTTGGGNLAPPYIPVSLLAWKKIASMHRRQP